MAAKLKLYVIVEVDLEKCKVGHPAFILENTVIAAQEGVKIYLDPEHPRELYGNISGI
jgi:hypothetical protein